MLLLHAAIAELFRKQGMGWDLFIFQHKSAKEELKAALITNFREKGWSSHLVLLVATMCEALGVQHTPVPDVPQLQCPCIIPVPALPSGCPQPLVHVSVLGWEVAEGYNAASKPCKHFFGSMKAWGETQGMAERRRVLRFLKESPAKVSAKTDLI